MAHGKGELTRQAILTTAVDRFGRDGYRATSVADIARDAGVSGTAAYAYFPDKEALFLAAVDDDAAGLIHRGLEQLVAKSDLVEWRETALFALVGAVSEHPLAERLLAGLEPDVTARVLDVPALADLRKAFAERIRADQLAGRVRDDIDPTTMASGMVSILLSLLMSVVQLGAETITSHGPDVAAVFEAALTPTRERARRAS